MKSGEKSAGRAARVSLQTKVLPPDSPVEVPNLPPVPDKNTPDEAARDARVRVDEQTESNWADGSAPQPRARNARSSLL